MADNKLMLENNQVLMEEMLDSTTGALEVIEHDHHEIHGGNMFRVQAFDDAVAADGTLIIGFNVSDQTKNPHFIFEWETESLGKLELLEGVTITASTGADVLIKNSRRDSTNTSIMQGSATGSWVSNYITKNPTITGGNIISFKKAYSNSRAGGGSGTRRMEIILKTDTEYAIKFTNEDSTAKGAQIRLEWYEHEDT